MKVNKVFLQKLIKEELEKVMNEEDYSDSALNPVTKFPQEDNIVAYGKGDARPKQDFVSYSVSLFQLNEQQKNYVLKTTRLDLDVAKHGQEKQFSRNPSRVKDTYSLVFTSRSATETLSAYQKIKEAVKSSKKNGLNIFASNLSLVGNFTEEDVPGAMGFDTGKKMSEAELEERAELEQGVTGIEKAETGRSALQEKKKK